MSNYTRAKDVQGVPANGGRFASPLHPEPESVALGGAQTSTSQELFTQARELENQIRQLKRDRNEVLLQSSIARAREQFPDAAELRLGFRQPYRYAKSHLTVTAIVGSDGTRREAGDGTIHTDNWQHDSGDGGFYSIELGISMMDGISAITKDGEGQEDRFDSDEQTNESIIDLR